MDRAAGDRSATNNRTTVSSIAMTSATADRAAMNRATAGCRPAMRGAAMRRTTTRRAAAVGGARAGRRASAGALAGFVRRRRARVRRQGLGRGGRHCSYSGRDRGDLGAHLLAERAHLFGHPVVDVHLQQHRVVADQQGRADQDHAHRDQQDREPDRPLAVAEHHDQGRHRGQAHAAPDERTQQPCVLPVFSNPVG